ncbi:MAG TPA: biotin--[acetyl-CoA-carboxylase] ligase [Aestuariivirgaceae bacterium]|jgi:BirA family biotin operon repressor/biotin-[acetyl-CoA-carboxylase] ligase
MDTQVRLPAGHRLIHCSELDSTNAEALRHAAMGERGPVWFWADTQSEGRGRQGRRWVSEPGNLYATLLTAIRIEPSPAAGLSILVPLAILRTFAVHLPSTARLELKWPNDVLLGGHKVAGILVESSLQAKQMIFAIGCGLNLRHAPPATRYGATTLAAHGSLVSPPAALETLAGEMDRLLKIWNAGAGFALLKAQWLQHAKGLGQRISVHTGGVNVDGYFEGLGANGSLLLRYHGGVREFHAGEIDFADISEGPA